MSISADAIQQDHASLPSYKKKILIIVESPTKAKKIEAYTQIKTIASMGHFKEMPKDDFAIDIENNYTPKFITSPTKKDQLEKIKKYAEGAIVYLASDDDREGYAIAFHFYQTLKKSASALLRMTYKEVTKDGIQKAMDVAIPFKETNMCYYDAFLGRRAGDRLVGYIMSPLISKKLQIQRLSAGRVQTPATRLLVEREREIIAFNTLKDSEKIFFEVSAQLEKDNKTFIVKNKENFKTKEQADNFIQQLKNAHFATIESLDKKERKRNAQPPFVTIAVQSAASSKFGFSPEKTMNLMQELFEGGAGEHEGIITYHRTDSFALSESFKQEVQSYLASKKIPYSNNQFKNKNSAQEGHEAIRPVQLIFGEDLDTAITVRGLTQEHKELFLLIQLRAIASLCEPALYDTTKITVKIKEATFTASGEILKSKGYLVIYDEDDDESDAPRKKKEAVQFPQLDLNEQVPIQQIEATQKSKHSPERYTEASLLKKLDSLGIGRPSTSATTIKTLKLRYASIEKKFLVPNENAFSIIGLLEKDDFWLCDYEFTKNMETSLDNITSGECTYLEFMKKLHEKMNFVLPSELNKREMLPIGHCLCGSTFYDFGSFYKCECKRSIQKNFLEHLVTIEEAKTLFEKNKVSFSGLKSKKGYVFSAYASFKPDEKYTFQIALEIDSASANQEIAKCRCGGALSSAPFGIVCNKCKLVVWQKSKTLAKPLSEKQMVKLAQGETITSKNILNKEGETYESSFKYEEYAPGKWGISFIGKQKS